MLQGVNFGHKNFCTLIQPTMSMDSVAKTLNAYAGINIAEIEELICNGYLKTKM